MRSMPDDVIFSGPDELAARVSWLREDPARVRQIPRAGRWRVLAAGQGVDDRVPVVVKRLSEHLATRQRCGGS